MIGMAKSISHGGNSLSYGQKLKHEKEGLKAPEVSRKHVVGNDITEISREFKMFQDTNTRCKNNTFHFVISPDPKDKLTADSYKQVVDKFLSKLSDNMNKDSKIKRNDIDLLNKNQHVAYLHTDTKTTHVHLYVNRIEMDTAKAVPDNHLAFKSGNVADQVAQEMNLTRAREVMQQNIQEQRLQNKQYYDIHRDVLKKKPKNLEQYSDMMAKKGLEPVFKYSNAGKPVGVSFKIGDLALKGSAIHPTMAAAKIAKDIAQSILLKPENIIQPKQQNKGFSQGL